MNISEIENHKIANKKLDLINKRVVELIRKNINKISERDVGNFILAEFKKENMVTDKTDSIHFVVVNEHTDDSHWRNSKIEPKIIKKNNLIMIDIWARLKEKSSPFADITWIFYTGNNIPKRIQEIFNKVINGRDIALDFIRKELKNKIFPETKKIDRVVRDYFDRFGLEKFFTHRTGHSLGYSSPHGNRFRLSKTSRKKIEPNILFTIEPGLYFKGEFGIRSEIDCYVTKDYRLIITSSLQKKIVKI